MKTYLIVLKKVDNYFYIKIGKTTNFKNRLRIYTLHNPLIENYISFDGDFEDELLWSYREQRIDNTEWIMIDYNIIDEVLENLDIKIPNERMVTHTGA